MHCVVAAMKRGLGWDGEQVVNERATDQLNDCVLQAQRPGTSEEALGGHNFEDTIVRVYPCSYSESAVFGAILDQDRSVERQSERNAHRTSNSG